MTGAQVAGAMSQGWQVGLRVRSRTLEPDAIDWQLGLVADHAAVDASLAWPYLWTLGSGLPGEAELDDHLRALARRCAASETAIADLAAEPGCEVGIDVTLTAPADAASLPSMYVPPDVIEFMARCRVGIDIDGYLVPTAGAPTADQPAADVAAALEFLTALQASAAAPPGPEAERARVEALAELRRLDDGTADDVVAKAAELFTPADRAELGQALREFAAWAEQPSDAAGARVDTVIAGLEKILGPLLESGRQVERKQTQQRIDTTVASSIADRLREAGIDPDR